MDSVQINSVVAASAANWDEFLSDNPTEVENFKTGVYSPVIIDVMYANKPFTPHHKDDPDKNGTAYSLTPESLKAAVDGGKFNGLPIFLNDLDEGTHGFGKDKRHAIGFTKGAIFRKDENMVQLLGGILANESPEEFKEIEDRKKEIGASAEFNIAAISEKDGVMEIGEITPTGSLLLRKDLAAFKETSIYCSDSAGGGETPVAAKIDQSDDIKPKGEQTPMTEICKSCAPQVDQNVQRRIDKEMKSFREELASFTNVKEQLAAADTKTAEIQTKLDESLAANETLTTKVTELEGEKTQAIAASKVAEQFKAMKDSYPEDKHQDVQRTLLKIELNDITPAEVLQLADWKIGKPTSTDSPLSVAASESGEKPKFSKDELDKMIKVQSWPGYVKEGD